MLFVHIPESFQCHPLAEAANNVGGDPPHPFPISCQIPWEMHLSCFYSTNSTQAPVQRRHAPHLATVRTSTMRLCRCRHLASDETFFRGSEAIHSVFTAFSTDLVTSKQVRSWLSE